MGWTDGCVVGVVDERGDLGGRGDQGARGGEVESAGESESHRWKKAEEGRRRERWGWWLGKVSGRWEEEMVRKALGRTLLSIYFIYFQRFLQAPFSLKISSRIKIVRRRNRRLRA